jgi:exopolyphosphatase/pppGpp-phosphohydrolase
MNLLKYLSEDELNHLKCVVELGQTCHDEPEHSQHVTRLALRLFDDLHKLHQLGNQERFWLLCASLLHDIGCMEGKKNHHHSTLRIILETPILLLVAVLCEGHVLLEDVPGTGKTTLARALAASLGCTFRRIQFTPDLLPSDVTGLSWFNQRTGV